MWLIDFVKNVWEKSWVKKAVSAIERPIREAKVENNKSAIGEIINTYNLPADKVDTDTIKTLQNIWSDWFISEEEKQYISELPQVYQTIFNSSKNLEQLKGFIYNDKFLNATTEQADEMKKKYYTNLDRLNYNLWRLEELKPWYKQWEELDRKYVEENVQLFSNKMKDISDIFWSNSEIAKSFNVTTYDAVEDVVDLKKQARDWGLEDNAEFQKMLSDLEKKKQQRQEYMYLKIKNNASELKNKSWWDAFDKIKEDDTLVWLSKEITDLQEDISQFLMKQSAKKAFLEFKPKLWLYKWAERLSSYLTRWLDEMFQKMAPVRATDLSDLQYLTSVKWWLANWAWAAANRALRNWWEISQLLIPYWALAKWAWLAAKWVWLATDAQKVINSLSKWKTAFNIVRWTVWIDSIFDYNLSAWLSDENTEANILLNVIWEGMWALRWYVKTLKSEKQAVLNAESFAKLYDNAVVDINAWDKTMKVNLFDFAWIKDKGSVSSILKKISEWASIDTKTFDISMQNALDDFLWKIKVWDKASIDEAKSFVREIFSKMADTFEDIWKKNKFMSDIESKISTTGWLENLLKVAKTWFNQIANKTISNIKANITNSELAFKELWAVPVENIEKVLDYKNEFIKSVSEYFSWKTLPKDIKTSLDSTIKKINETWKVSDSNVMEIVRAFNKSFWEWKAADYFKNLVEFIRWNLKYIPEWLKSIENLNKVSSLFDTKFINNIKKAWIQVRFSKLWDWIWWTFKNDSAIISIAKDFYKNPDDFVIWFVHELTHGLINKSSKLYEEFSSEYVKSVSDMNKYFSDLYEWFDIKNVDFGKLDEMWFTTEEIDYIKTLSYKYKNVDEFVAYNLSEALLWMKKWDNVEILKNRVISAAETAFPWNDLDAAFRVAADKILDWRFQVWRIDNRIWRDIENYMYAANWKKILTKDIVDIASSIENIWSIKKMKEIIDDVDIQTLASNLQRKDKQIYNILMESYSKWDDMLQEFMKQSALNGMVTWHKWYEAMVSWWLWEVFTDFENYMKYSDWVDSPILLKKYIDEWLWAINSIIRKIDFMLWNIPFESDKFKSIRNALEDLKVMTQYYQYVDIIWKIKSMPNPHEFDSIKISILWKIDELKTARWVDVKKLYGISKKTTAKEVLWRWIADIVKDLQKTVWTKWVEMHDYLLRTFMKKEVATDKAVTIWFWTWREFVKAMGLELVNKNTVPQDVFNTIAWAQYIRKSQVASTLYGMWRIFGIDSKQLKNDFVKTQIFWDIENKSFSSLIEKYSENAINTTKQDVLDFLNMSDFVITADNVQDIFNVVYWSFDYKLARELSSRISDVLKNDKQLSKISSYIDEAMSVADSLAVNESKIVNKYLDIIENSLWFPVKKDIWELTPMAKLDVSISPEWKIWWVRASDWLVYREVDWKFVANVDQSQAISSPDFMKWVVSSSIIYNMESSNLYATLWLKKWNYKWVAKFMNDTIYSWKIDNSWIEKLGWDIKDLKNWDNIPLNREELNTYSKIYENLYQDCIKNFWLEDDVTKFVWAKKSIINQYRALISTSDDVNYYRILSDVSRDTTSMLYKEVDKLEKLAAKWDKESLSKANEIIASIKDKFDVSISSDDVKNNINATIADVKKWTKYLMPGSKQPRWYSLESVKNIPALNTFVKNLKTSMRDMSRESLSNRTKYTARLGESDFMINELKWLASNWISTKTFAVKNSDILSSYQWKYIADNVASSIWKTFEKVKNFSPTIKDWVPMVEFEAISKIKDNVANVVSWRFWVDAIDFKKSIKVEYVKPQVVNVTYVSPNWESVSYFMDVKMIDDISKYYQYWLTREEILDWKTVSFKIWWAWDDVATHNVIADWVKYNWLLDQQSLDVVDMSTSDDLITPWKSVAKDILGNEYVKTMLEDDYVPKILSFLMTNQEVLKESSTDTYNIVSQLNFAVTRYADEAASKITAIKWEKKMLKKFWEEYMSNKEFVKALILWKKLIPNWLAKIRWVLTDSIDEIKKAFDSWTYKLSDFALENWFGLADVDDIEKAIKYSEKQLSNVWQYAWVKYFLDKVYWPNLLMKYEWQSTKLVDDMISFYADVFKWVYDSMWAKIDVEMVREEIEKYLINKKSLNVVWFNNDMKWFKIFEDITKTLKWKPWWEWLMTIEESLFKWNLHETQRTRIYDDLMWKSLWWDTWLSNIVSLARRETYALQLWRWSPKAWVISAQNIVSNWVEIFSKRESMLDIVPEIEKLNKRMSNSPYFKIDSERLFWKDWNVTSRLSLAQASQGKNLEIWWASVVEWVINRVVDLWTSIKEDMKKVVWIDWNVTDYIEKKTWIRIPSNSEIAATLSSPVWLADKITSWRHMNNLAYNKAFDELWVSTDTLNSMLDEIEKIDKELVGKKWLDRELLNSRKTELINTYKWIMNYVTKEALFEFNSLYKAGTMAWLMRNWFSKRTAFTFFSTRGSKKAWEYIYGALYKPFANAYTAYKRWGLWAMWKVLSSELLTNRHWNALFKQSVYAARSMFQLNKDSNLDTVWEEDFWTWFMTVSPFWQALKSFFITRSLWQWFEQYRVARREWLSMWDSIKYWLSTALYWATSQLYKDIKFFTWPIALAIKEAWTDGSEWDVLNSIADKIRYNFNTSLYYSMYDMYQWLPDKRLDSDTMYPFLDAIMGDVVTKYRYDMDKFIDDVYLQNKIEDWSIKIDWLKQLSSWLLWFPSTYNKKFALDQLNAIKENDLVFKEIVDWKLTSIPESIKSNVMKYFMEHNWWWEFDLWTDKWNIDWKVWLILNELRSQWVDIQWLTDAMNKWDMKSAQKEMLILQASWMTKAESTTVLAYMANSAYQEMQSEYRKAWISLSKNPEVKELVYRQLFDIVIPTAIWLDKQVHSDVLYKYVQSAYGWKIPWLKELELNEEWWISSKWWTDPDIIKMFKLWLLADVADVEEVAFRKDLLTNAGQRMLQDVPDEAVAKKTVELFEFVDWLKNVSEWWKMVAKASMLYWNLNRIKVLLNSKYAPWMEDDMLKLSEIIWNTNDALQVNPDLLNAIADWGKWKKIKAPKSIDLQKDVIKSVRELNKSIPEKIKSRTLDLTYKRINAKLKELSLPKLQVTKDEYKEIAMTPIWSTPLKTADIKVAEWKPTTSKPKIKLSKPVARRDEQIRKPKPTKPTRISDRKS